MFNMKMLYSDGVSRYDWAYEYIKCLITSLPRPCCNRSDDGGALRRPHDYVPTPGIKKFSTLHSVTAKPQEGLRLL